MKLKQMAILTLINLLTAIGIFAAPPSNDNFANAEILSGMQVHISRSNTEASKETGEPNHANNTGGKSIWFKWIAPMSRVMAVTTNRSSTNLDTLINVYTGTGLANLSNVRFNNNIDSAVNLKSFLTFSAVAGTTYYIAVDGYRDGMTPPAEGAFMFDIHPFFKHQEADYDSDGMTDFSLFRPSTGAWMVSGTTSNFTDRWGTNGDIPMVVSFSPVLGQTVFRPSNGTWYHRPSCCTDSYFRFGTAGDIPVVANFTNDGSNIAVFRPSNGVWYIHTFAGSDLYYQFGLAGDIPVAGDYSPDPFADVAVFRPSNGLWYFMIRQNGNQSQDVFRAVQFGQQGDKPVPADYDGDGILDIAVYRPSTGTWWVLRSSDGQVTSFRWGIAEDIPTTGDFDGDGKFDYAVFRPSEGKWYVYRIGDGSIQIKEFGQTGDIPMTSNLGK